MENATLQNPMAIIEAEIERVMNAAPRSDYVRIPVQVAAACRTALAAQSEADDLRAEVERLRGELHFIKRTGEMSAGIMRDRKRTGGWEGAENTADAFARIARRAEQALAGQP